MTALSPWRTLARPGLWGGEFRRLAKRARGPAEGARLGYPEVSLFAEMMKGGCPICRWLVDSERGWFFAYLHEMYLEPESLGPLARSLGFCRAHAHYLVRHGKGGPQIVSAHEVVARRIRGILTSEREWRRLAAEVAVSGGRPGLCPACHAQAGSGERAAHFFVKLLRDARTAERYGASGLLCPSHLALAAPSLDDSLLERTLAIHDRAVVAALPAAGDAPGDRWACEPALWVAVGCDREWRYLPRTDDVLPDGAHRDPIATLAADMRSADRCPVCCEIDRSWRDWVGWLESAAGDREIIEDVLPTCPDHVWEVMRVAGPLLGRAVVERALFAAFHRIRFPLERLRADPPQPNFRRPIEALQRMTAGRRDLVRLARSVLAREPPCPLCGRLARARDRTLGLLFLLLEQGRHRAGYESGHGLCLGHFARAVALGPDPAVGRFLRKMQAAKLGVLEWELAEYSRKAAWHARPETKGAEQRAPRRALCLFSGYPQVADA
ncbi:MAG: hypothetical protein HY521_15505 [Proteobacteria bacterium]|nr:hypothetical protein [Pseudomonadota bacterium]